MSEIIERLGRVLILRRKIHRTIYADSHGESKEDVLRALDSLIEKLSREAWDTI